MTDCVLVAEDDDLNRFVIEQQLSALGFEVIACRDGAESVQLFREKRPDAVLLDIHMPGMGGDKVASAIRSMEAELHWARTPILAFTSDDDHEVRQQCLDAGVDGFVIKPATPAQLSMAIGKHLVR